MKLKFITCSGLNENTDIREMVSLTEIYPKMEIAVQISGNTCSFDSPRYKWLQNLQEYLLQREKAPNLALHINADWVERFCSGRNIPEELKKVFKYFGSEFNHF